MSHGWSERRKWYFKVCRVWQQKSGGNWVVSFTKLVTFYRIKVIATPRASFQHHNSRKKFYVVTWTFLSYKTQENNTKYNNNKEFLAEKHILKKTLENVVKPILYHKKEHKLLKFNRLLPVIPFWDSRHKHRTKNTVHMHKHIPPSLKTFFL